MQDFHINIRSLFVAFGIVLTLSCSTVLTPLWIDSISDDNNTFVNNSNVSFVSDKHVDSYAVIFIVNFVYLILSGILFLILIIFSPQKITEKDRKFPKTQYILIGFSDAVSTVCLVYASSGTRTAPYLQSIASNFGIPVTFLIRFIILRKRPTCRKFCCAGLVLVAEFIALIPNIFPSLEGNNSHKNDGGATGLAGVLWPLCYFFGFIPQGLVSVLIEKVSKTRLGDSPEDTLHPVVLMFWTYLFCFGGLCLLFWTDVVPGFGGADNFTDFWNLFTFNVLCFIGAAHCNIQVHICSILCITAMLITRVLVIIFLKISEGANYLVIIMSLQTPVVVLFWNLFVEEPFHFSPHQDLSTWLSLVAVAIMIPSIYVYSTGSADFHLDKTTDENKKLLKEETQNRYDRFGYLSKSSDSYQSIDVLASSTDDQGVFNPHIQAFTDSYQSMQSHDSSVNSFRNSYLSRYNYTFQRNASI